MLWNLAIILLIPHLRQHIFGCRVCIVWVDTDVCRKKIMISLSSKFIKEALSYLSYFCPKMDTHLSLIT